jgi:urease alpha subunit
MFNLKGEMPDFNFNVVTSEKGGHSPDAIAEMCVDKLISVSDNAHPAIREQAKAYREHMLKIVRHYISMAMQEDRATMCAQIREAGFHDLADQLRRL